MMFNHVHVFLQGLSQLFRPTEARAELLQTTPLVPVIANTRSAQWGEGRRVPFLGVEQNHRIRCGAGWLQRLYISIYTVVLQKSHPISGGLYRRYKNTL